MSPTVKKSNPSAIPSVDRLLRDDAAIALTDQYGRAAVLDAVRVVLSSLRRQMSSQDATDNTSVDYSQDGILARAATVLEALMAPSLKRVFNLTGTVLHTNLGRAPLPDVAIAAMVAAAGASNVEYDLAKGRRGDRDDHLEGWIKRLTGAEAATIVNNNAAAVLLLLNTLGQDKEVIVSRGELIEIGGAFRIPDIMTRAGCVLREVGTTNRTHAKDFAGAIGEDTALLMKVHASNYAIEGFTAAVPEKTLATLAHDHDIPFVVDLGAGMLVEMERFGLPHEPTPAESIADGADLVTFSGDKLLGGPQCGIIVGRADLVARIKENPMKRALRVDKVTIAALEAVLRLYADPDSLVEKLPTLRLLARSAEDIEAAARRLAPEVSKRLGSSVTVSLIACQSQIGSGSLPVDRLESAALELRPVTPAKGAAAALRQLVESFRSLPAPVIGRVRENALILDLRCLEDEAGFIAQLDGLLNS
ncbi:MAG: L-seryl-tRNA(Sec) selenium transferase [Alphaproteobacteria bacterium]|nr:L-seryl-tRNA(Sec) selenium transferase [Alphaproteobacteria bacterium]